MTIKKILTSILYFLFISNSFGQITLKMTEQGGVYTMPCLVNGLKLNFIFDTGASDVSISLTEALFMFKNGYLTEIDITGTEYYSIANGDIAEGTTILLKEVDIEGLKLHNVKASIVHNLDAPLLLGQSALRKLGRIEFNYANNTLYIYKNGTNIEVSKSIITPDTIITVPDNPVESEFKNDKGSFVDERDLEMYRWVRIGNQIWMTDNLRATKYTDGESIPYISKKRDWKKLNQPAYCWYDNFRHASKQKNYGALYNWHVVKTEKICPCGWRIPNGSDWLELQKFLNDNGYSNNEGQALKYVSDYNFHVIYSGERTFYGRFYNTSRVYWWSSTENDSNSAYYRVIYKYDNAIIKDYSYKNSGFSIRCIKD